MAMIPFASVFKELGPAEMRTLFVGAADGGRADDLPEDAYTLVELYCDEHHCDCRRVLIHVFAQRRKKLVATINYAFEPPDRHAPVPEQMFLDPLNVQSAWSGELLDLFNHQIQSDGAFRRRLIRHYEFFKRALNDPNDPHHRIMMEVLRAEDPEFEQRDWKSSPWRIRQRMKARQKRR